MNAGVQLDFLLIYVFETCSQVAQAGLELIMLAQDDLNFGSSCPLITGINVPHPVYVIVGMDPSTLYACQARTLNN